MRVPLEALIDAYFVAWNETDPARRQAVLDAVWANDATYTDPTTHAIGAAALSAHIGRVLVQFPGSRVIRISAIDAHHDVVRFAFRRILADGTARPDGIDFSTVADGKITRIVGFFGPLATN
jgi:ketosteroid isomerase-like protein